MSDPLARLIEASEEFNQQLESCKEELQSMQKQRELDAQELKHLQRKVARRDQALSDVKDKWVHEASGHSRYIALSKELKEKKLLPEEKRKELKAPVDTRAVGILEARQEKYEQEMETELNEADEKAEAERKEKEAAKAEAERKAMEAAKKAEAERKAKEAAQKAEAERKEMEEAEKADEGN